jgi:hypothetical protein
LQKSIWNSQITIKELLIDDTIMGSYSLSIPNVVNLKVDDTIKNDVDYSLELATVLSYFAYIIENPNDTEANALMHAQKTYLDIIANVIAANPKAKFINPRNFKEFLQNKTIEPQMDGTYYFTGQ